MVTADRAALRQLGQALRSAGHSCVEARGVRSGQRMLASQTFDAVLLDADLGYRQCLAIGRRASEQGVALLVLGDFWHIDQVRLVDDAGAFDWLVRPWEEGALLTMVEGAVARGATNQRNGRTAAAHHLWLQWSVSVLNSLARELAKAGSTSQVAQLAATSLAAPLGSSICRVYFLASPGRTPILLASCGAEEEANLSWEQRAERVRHLGDDDPLEVHLADSEPRPRFTGVRGRVSAFVPLLAGDRTVGVVDLLLPSTMRDSTFVEGVLTHAGSIIGLSLERAYLTEHVVAGESELATLRHLGRLINSGLDLHILLTLIAQRAGEATSASHAMVAYVDEATKEPQDVALWGYHFKEATRAGREPFSSRRSNVARALRTGRAVQVSDVQGQSLHSLAENSRAELVIPITHDSEMLGVVAVASPRPGAFDSADLSVLSGVSNCAAVAIHNARLAREASRLQSNVQNLLAFSERLASRWEMPEVLNQLTEFALDVVETAQTAGVFVYDERREVLILRSAIGLAEDRIGTLELPRNEGLVARMFRGGQAIVAMAGPQNGEALALYRALAPSADEAGRSGGPASLVCVPMMSRGQAVGCLVALSSGRQPAPGATDLVLLRAAANLAALAAGVEGIAEPPARAARPSRRSAAGRRRLAPRSRARKSPGASEPGGRAKETSPSSEETQGRVNAIIGLTGALLASVAGQGSMDVPAALSRLYGQAHALRDLVGGPPEVAVLDRTSDPQWTLLELEGAIEAAASQAYAKADRKDQRLVVQVSDEVAQVWADEERLRKMLSHLIAAAVKQAPTHSTIHIQASREDGEFIISLSREDATDQEGPAASSRGPLTLEMAPTFEAARRLAQEHGGRLLVDGGPVPGTMASLALPLVT